MDYRKMYFELFRAQSDEIEILQKMADRLCGLTDRIKIAHLTAEQILLNEGENIEAQEP